MRIEDPVVAESLPGQHLFGVTALLAEEALTLGRAVGNLGPIADTLRDPAPGNAFQ